MSFTIKFLFKKKIISFQILEKYKTKNIFFNIFIQICCIIFIVFVYVVYILIMCIICILLLFIYVISKNIETSICKPNNSCSY